MRWCWQPQLGARSVKHRSWVAFVITGDFMYSTELQDEMREANLSYLMLAQKMIRADRAAAMLHLGLSEDLADLIDKLSAAQVIKLSTTNMLLSRFRFEDEMVVKLITDHGKSNEHSKLHAAIFMANQRVEEIS